MVEKIFYSTIWHIFNNRKLKMQQIIKKTETILERLDRKIEELAERFF